MGYHYKYKEYIYRHMYPKKAVHFLLIINTRIQKAVFWMTGFVSFVVREEERSL